MAKWTRGGRITDPRIVIDFILAGDVVFNGHKPQNAGWLQNWSISQIKMETSRGRFFIALPSHLNLNPEASK
ncbi:hypothetical protein GCM10011491_30360 [Brucella endophytica]|uniref:Uncharacterized protein n=1 Tax=Brucella endophytica TaxID=1963359 RepID=A0A916WGW5_9HYPH|nr:hypothetical protein GCM10011491_30360 [Brucella endophytica]